MKIIANLFNIFFSDIPAWCFFFPKNCPKKFLFEPEVTDDQIDDLFVKRFKYPATENEER